MIHSKNLKNLSSGFSSGFSFMEVMIALVMFGMLLSAVLSLQNVTFGSITDFSSKLMYIFDLKNALFNSARARAEQKEPAKTAPPPQENQPKVTYSIQKINEKSSLKKFEHCLVEKALVQWQEGRKKLQETMITFLYKAPEKKEKEK